MTQEQYSTKGRKFKHLTMEKRAQLEMLLRLKRPKAEIARLLGISRSTLYNELKRGTVDQLDSQLRPYRCYFSDAGQRVYETNRQNSQQPLKLVKAFEFLRYAERKMLEEKWAPDAICGEAKRSGRFAEMVCTKTLYSYIDQCLLRVRNIDLPQRVRRKRRKGGEGKAKRQYGQSIDLRPAEVDTRTTFGHWEIDTVVGTKDSAPVLLTLDERMTRYRHIIKIPSRSAQAVEEGIHQLQALYGEHFPQVFRSITCDNGSEFATLHRFLQDTPIYYAHPYSSFERGTNEKQNSLIRRFIPKGHSLCHVHPDDIRKIQDWINRLPRKLFDYASAEDFFYGVLFDVAI